MIRNNRDLEDLQLSGCHNAVDDTSMRLISNLEYLTFLDISYSKTLTDKGLASYNEKTVPLQAVIMNGCPSISSAGLGPLITSCASTLLDFECADCDQPEMKNDLLQKLAICWNLVTLDVTGCVNIDD